MDITLPDGRSLHVLVTGDPAAPPVVYHVGTPHGLTPEPEMVDAVTGRGLSLVSVARPGYPGSSALPGRTVAAVAADTATVLNALGHGEFATLGWSGGGPHALACAALLPGCRAAALVASVAPPDAAGLDFLAGMGGDNIEEFGAAREGSAALGRWLEAAASGLATVTGADVVASMASLLPAPDRAVLSGERGDQMAAAVREALADGIAGWRDDDLAFVAPWGFDPAAVPVPVSVWQGAHDLMVPLAHGRWLAAAVPGARLHLLDDDGHLSLVTRLEEVIAELVALAGW